MIQHKVDISTFSIHKTLLIPCLIRFICVKWVVGLFIDLVHFHADDVNAYLRLVSILCVCVWNGWDQKTEVHMEYTFFNWFNVPFRCNSTVQRLCGGWWCEQISIVIVWATALRLKPCTSQQIEINLVIFCVSLLNRWNFVQFIAIISNHLKSKRLFSSAIVRDAVNTQSLLYCGALHGMRLWEMVNGDAYMKFNHQRRRGENGSCENDKAVQRATMQCRTNRLSS